MAKRLSTIIAAAIALAGTLALTSGAFGNAKIDYVKEIKPLFKKHCYECHGPKKQKGKYRIDQKKLALKGDNIVPFKSDDSWVHISTDLPEDDPDVMPQDSPRLPQEKIDLIKRWIDEGAVWPDGVDDPAVLDEGPPKIEVPELTDAQKKAEATAIKKVTDKGGLALRVANNTQAVDVNLSLIGSQITDKDLADLKGLEGTLVWLNIARTKVSDGGLDHLKNFKELRRLHLENTAIGDSGLAAITGLQKLEYLNLYGTKVSDAGLDHVAKLKNLKKIYLWQTSVTDPGVAKLQKALPDATIDVGKYAEEMAKAAAERQRQAEEEKKKAEAEAKRKAEEEAKLAASLTFVNTKCIIADKPVDETKFAIYNGSKFGFCCDKCKNAFKADPKKQQAKIDAAVKALPVSNAKCPVSGEPIDESKFVLFKSKKVAFCCDKCKAAFEKDPTKFESKIAPAAAGATAAAEATASGLTIKKVMAAHKKDQLFAKVTTKKAGEDEVKQLVEMYKYLTTATPPKGDKAKWEERTKKIHDAATALIGDIHNTDKLTALKDAANCKDCHKLHKPAKK